MITGRSDYTEGSLHVAEKRRSTACCCTCTAAVLGTTVWLICVYITAVLVGHLEDTYNLDKYIKHIT